MATLVTGALKHNKILKFFWLSQKCRFGGGGGGGGGGAGGGGGECQRIKVWWSRVCPLGKLYWTFRAHLNQQHGKLYRGKTYVQTGQQE